MATKIAFFDAKSYDRENFNSTNGEFGFDITYYKERLSLNTVSLTKGMDAVCIFVNAECDYRVIERLKENGVKIIALRCAGFNNVDIKAAREAGIKVVRVPAYSPHAVAEYAVTLMLALNRKVYRSVYRTREGNFRLGGLMGFDMYGKDLYPDEAFAKEYQVKMVTLDELYEGSDIISLHCPLTEETKFIINNDSITKMKYGVMIINTGRGKLIKTEDLINGLRSHQVGSAALDVYEEEADYFYEDRSDRMIDDDKLALLLMMPNVIVTSHQAFFTKEATHNIAVTTLQNIRDFEEGKELVNEVK